MGPVIIHTSKKGGGGWYDINGTYSKKNDKSNILLVKYVLKSVCSILHLLMFTFNNCVHVVTIFFNLLQTTWSYINIDLIYIFTIN